MDKIFEQVLEWAKCGIYHNYAEGKFREENLKILKLVEEKIKSHNSEDVPRSEIRRIIDNNDKSLVEMLHDIEVLLLHNNSHTPSGVCELRDSLPCNQCDFWKQSEYKRCQDCGKRLRQLSSNQ